MRKEVIETGKTVDAAIDSACLKLGCDRDDCEWEIIDLPKKTFLGLKTIPAKVRVAIELPEEKKPAAKPIQKPAPKPAAKPAPSSQQAQKPAPAKREEPPLEAPAPKMAVSAEPKERAESREEERVLIVEEQYSEKERSAKSYIEGILGEFGLNATLQIYREGHGVCINVTGEGLGTIIGRRGETLDAIQYLTGLVANRLGGDYLRVTVDCGDYRAKRKETLEALARKLSAQVLKTNISKTLEPMNPFERRVIHATVSKIDGVSSSSIGEEPNRRVIITSPTARRAAPRSGYSREGGRDRERDGRRRPSGGRDRDRGDRRPPRSGGSRGPAPQAPTGPPKETPESTMMDGTPMGKLDLD